MSDKPSAPERVQSLYHQLHNSAAALNAASNELSNTVSVLDEALKKLKLGISAWVKITGGGETNGDYWNRDIGYARVGNLWGIALRTETGNVSYPEKRNAELCLFDDAPRWMRIEGVEKIPELLEKLIHQADDTTKRIKQKTATAKELAAAIKTAAAESKPTNELPLEPTSLGKPAAVGSEPSLSLPLTPPTARK